MALKVTEGRYIISSAKDLEKACALLRDLQSVVEVQEAIQDMDSLKKAISQFMSANHINESTGFQLIRSYDKLWIMEDRELDKPAVKAGHKSLRSIIGKRIVKRKGKKPINVWNFITKRVVDRERLDLAVKRGYIELDEIAPAMVQKPKVAYIRAKGDNGGDEDSG